MWEIPISDDIYIYIYIYIAEDTHLKHKIYENISPHIHSITVFNENDAIKAGNEINKKELQIKTLLTILHLRNNTKIRIQLQVERCV